MIKGTIVVVRRNYAPPACAWSARLL